MSAKNHSKLQVIRNELEQIVFTPRGKSSAPTELFPDIPIRWANYLKHLKEAADLQCTFYEQLDSRVNKNHLGVPENFAKIFRALKAILVIMAIFIAMVTMNTLTVLYVVFW